MFLVGRLPGKLFRASTLEWVVAGVAHLVALPVATVGKTSLTKTAGVRLLLGVHLEVLLEVRIIFELFRTLGACVEKGVLVLPHMHLQIGFPVKFETTIVALFPLLIMQQHVAFEINFLLERLGALVTLEVALVRVYQQMGLEFRTRIKGPTAYNANKIFRAIDKPLMDSKAFERPE